MSSVRNMVCGCGHKQATKKIGKFICPCCGNEEHAPHSMTNNHTKIIMSSIQESTVNGKRITEINWG